MDNNLNIGYLGPKGTYSYRAAELYSQKLNKIPFNSINEVLGSLKDKSTDLVIVPLMCVICVAIPFVLVTIAPRFITAAEVNLFLLLETILGPLWVWIVIKEQPSTETLLGGFLIILTIAVHSFLAIKKT